jgi:superfamily I DNA/RNA helicase
MTTSFHFEQRQPNAIAPSRYQTAIYHFVRDGKGSAAVNAVAGAGKTTTLVSAAEQITGTALFCAFNRHVVNELDKRLAGTQVKCKTIHSIGRQTISSPGAKVDLDEYKYNDLIRDYLDKHPRTRMDEPFDLAYRQLLGLINFSRLTLTNAEDEAALESLAAHYGLGYQPAYARAVAEILDVGEEIAHSAGVIDYTDMLWLPHRWKLTPRKYKWLFIDECQDLNAAQIDLLRKCLDANGRCLAVGDPRQSIMGFAGAEIFSFQSVKDGFRAQTLPLSICYRCPRRVVELAREIVPNIEPAPHARNGIVDHISEASMRQKVCKGDLVICRRTAPVITACIQLIRQRVAARVRGRDIGQDLADLTRIIGEDKPLRQFLAGIEHYRTRRLLPLQMAPNHEQQAQHLRDQLDALEACYEGFSGQCNSVESLAQKIEGLFADDEPDVWLSTVHRAKGLEANRVFILEPALLGQGRDNQQTWELEQERNIKYVALTRACEALYFCD